MNFLASGNLIELVLALRIYNLKANTIYRPISKIKDLYYEIGNGQMIVITENINEAFTANILKGETTDYINKIIDVFSFRGKYYIIQNHVVNWCPVTNPEIISNLQKECLRYNVPLINYDEKKFGNNGSLKHHYCQMESFNPMSQNIPIFK